MPPCSKLLSKSLLTLPESEMKSGTEGPVPLIISPPIMVPSGMFTRWLVIPEMLSCILRVTAFFSLFVVTVFVLTDATLPSGE